MTSQIVKKLRESRLQRGITLRSLGESVGLSHSMVASIESGSRDPKLGDVEALAAQLGLELTIGPQGGPDLQPDDLNLAQMFRELLALAGPNEKEIWNLEIQTRLRQIHASRAMT